MDTTPSTVDGGLWLDTTDNVPVLWLRKGEYEYWFNYSGLRYIGSNEYLKCYLPFDTSLTADAGGNLWKPIAVDKITLPSLDYSMKKFGSASVWLPESSYLIAENIFNFNAGKWTVDFWFYGVLSSSTFNKCVFGLGSKNKYHGIGLYYDGYWFGNETASEWGERNSNYHPKANQWVHIAVVKDNSNFYFFEDGVLVWHVTVATAIADNHSIELGAGASNYATPDGAMYIDSFRYFDGIALWTSDFTPPTASDYSDFTSSTTSSTIQSDSSGGTARILDTVPATVDGGIWYEITDNVPTFWIRKDNYEYSFDGKLKYVGNNTNLVAHLPFTKSLADACCNEWTAFGAPTFYSETVYTSADNVNKAGRLYLNGSSYLKNNTIADSIGNQPWSADMWWEPKADAFDKCPFGINAMNNDTNSDGRLNWFLKKDDSYFWSSVVVETHISISPNIKPGDLVHLAMTYDGSCLRTFVNGVLKQSITASLTIKSIFSIGAMTSGEWPINGYISHFRIHKGVALWTSDFTPPTAADYS